MTSGPAYRAFLICARSIYPVVHEPACNALGLSAAASHNGTGEALLVREALTGDVWPWFSGECAVVKAAAHLGAVTTQSLVVAVPTDHAQLFAESVATVRRADVLLNRLPRHSTCGDTRGRW